ncbi:MBL fold metallo-hydrolase [Fontisphaera persica]|uniref:MBL fold metallo-hydrolase RNA specificity domain-containing protein n=1 Tax=Fontisphaera persica TaxID=2974023 RepID=UPI0024BF46AA|nr:MBL fold metallo-hydrolase [Fontisphaera persica]WCJ58672.1 MBL fold metallo-hydrolase [Fontisphaera persica]
MRVTFYGATRTTTGSLFLLEVNQQRFLLECGLFQGRRGETIERNRNFPFDPARIDAVILSHAHIDHCGNLPNLCRHGFSGNIYCTFATRDLASIMLEDSAQIQRADAEFVSKKRAKQGLPPVEPLYTATEAEMAVRQFVAINYDRPMPVGDGVTLTFRDAGHILGSAQVVLDIRENGRRFRYLFSGDIGRGNDDILRDPQPVEKVDFLQIEATYGGREHTAKPQSIEMLATLVSETLAQNGKVIIPSFSVGRTQQIVYELHQATLAGRIPKVPIFVDSPLSVNATEIYRLHPECFNDRIYKFLREVANPFGMENLTYIREQAHSMKLNEMKEPAIIISASGMAEAGRIRHHLKNHIGNPANLVLFIGYCAEHTLGAQILAGRSPVNIFGEPHPVRAKVASIDAFSGHADKNELMAYVRRLDGQVKKVAVIHGEESQCLAFAEALRQWRPQAEITVPRQGDTLEV